LKKKIIVLFKNYTDFEFFYRNKNFCDELIKNFRNIEFLNLNNKNYHNVPKKYHKYFYRVKNYKNFNRHFNGIENYICISFLERNFENFKFFKFFKKKKTFLIEIFAGGDLRDTKYFFNTNLLELFKKINLILKKNINFIIYLLSYRLKILPRTDLLFHYNNNTRDQVGYCFTDSYKFTLFDILKKTLLKKNLFFKRTCLINSINNNKLIKKEKIKNKYIVFLDSCFEHHDRFEYESRPKINDKIKYYQEINETFKDIKNFIFLLHPNSNLLIIKKYLKDVLVIKYKTQFFLQRSKLILFHESSSISNAIYLKKKIISLDSDYLGRYFKYRSQLYANALNLKVINLSNKRAKSQIEKIVLNSLLRKDKKQKEYIFSNKTNRNGLEDIINEIKNLN
jgi:hypothetical protein